MRFEWSTPRNSLVCELFSDLADLILGGRPIRFAGIAVQDQVAGLQRTFEFCPCERDREVMIVRTHSVQFGMIVH